MLGRRLRRRLGFDRNPLRRRSDRIETVIRTVLIVIFLVSGPLAAIGVGHYVGDGADRGASAQTQRHQVRAVVAGDPAPLRCGRFGCRQAMTLVRWTTPGGSQRTAEMRVPGLAHAGDHVTLWVDKMGAPTAPPPGNSDYTGASVAAAAFTVLAIAVVCLLAGIITHAELNVRRMTAWQNRWSVVEPMWSGRR
jgi:hypothetical protein